MRNFFIVLITMSPVFSFAQLGGKFDIRGQIESDTLINGRVFLEYRSGRTAFYFDSTILKNNRYRFKGEFKEGAVSANISIFTSNPDTLEDGTLGTGLIRMPFFELSPGKITVLHKNDHPNIKEGSNIIKGSKAQDELDRLGAEIEKGTLTRNEVLMNFITHNPDSWNNIKVLYTLVRDPSVKPDTLDRLYKGLGARLKQYSQIEELGTYIENTRKTALGATAFPFTQQDVNGKSVSLSDFSGKYVLVDFWASWCEPCRQENPHLVKAYAKYHDKGFEILGVSLDNEKQKDDWIKAIKEDSLTWTNVSDLKGWKNDVAVLYGINSVPTNLLIDPSGVIVAKNLRREKLEEKLLELLGSSAAAPGDADQHSN